MKTAWEIFMIPPRHNITLFQKCRHLTPLKIVQQVRFASGYHVFCGMSSRCVLQISFCFLSHADASLARMIS